MEDEIEIPKTKVESLNKVIEFLTYYENRQFSKIQKPLRSANLLEHGASQWDFEFISGMGIDKVSDLMITASFLDLKDLVSLCCAFTASQIKGKSV